MKPNIPETETETETVTDNVRIVERPDGFYWMDQTSGETFGPFPTLAEAEADMDYTPESDYEPAESLAEAEEELGIAGWMDPDTGELAEDTLTHLEDH